MILYGQITNEVLLLSYSIVFSEKLRAIMYILSKLDHSAVLQARNPEETAYVVLTRWEQKKRLWAYGTGRKFVRANLRSMPGMSIRELQCMVLSTFVNCDCVIYYC